MNFQKKQQDVLGVKKSCPNYAACPLCYGCRNFDSSYYECLECMQNKKNVCNKSKHTDEALGKMFKLKEFIKL